MAKEILNNQFGGLVSSFFDTIVEKEIKYIEIDSEVGKAYWDYMAVEYPVAENTLNHFVRQSVLGCVRLILGNLDFILQTSNNSVKQLIFDNIGEGQVAGIQVDFSNLIFILKSKNKIKFQKTIYESLDKNFSFKLESILTGRLGWLQ